MSERDIPLRFRHEPDSQQIHSSKSVPALHSKCDRILFYFKKDRKNMKLTF